MDREESAIQFFMGSSSTNATAILERILNPKGPRRIKYDYDDTTFLGFHYYLKYAYQKPKYSFLTEVVRQVDARNPNKELGKLDLFYNAYFSPRSTYLTIYTTNQAVVMEARSGKVLEVIPRSYDMHKIADGKIIFSKDEQFILKYIEISNTSYSESHKKIVSYENYHTKKVIWKKEFINRVEASFSKDYSKVIIFNYDINEYTKCNIMYIDKTTGKVLSKKTLTHMTGNKVEPLFRNNAATYIDYFPEFHGDNVRI
jgi:hypothetical protein